MLVGLFAFSGALNAMDLRHAAAVAAASEPAASQAQANNGNAVRNANPVSQGIYDGVVQLIGGTIIVGGATFIAQELKEYFWGDKAAKAQKEDAAAVDKEIDIEGKKINLALTEAKSLTDQYQALVLLYNGGNNTGLDKKEIQAEIKKVWEAMKTNSSESALIIKTAKDRIKELEQKRNAVKARASAAQTLAQATQLPIHTKQATPESVAKMLAASTARTA